MSQVLIPERAKVIIILGLAIAGIALWKWEEHKKQPTAPTELELPVQLIGSSSGVLPEPQLKTSQEVSEAWQNCFNTAVSAENLNELLDEAIAQDTRSKAEVSIENLHLHHPQGQELRLHTRLNDVSGKTEVLLFGVDDQGYPLPQKFPGAVQTQSNDEKKNWFLRQGNLSMTEKVYDLNADGVQGRWKSRNQHLVSLEVFLADRSLSCGENLTSCRCRR